MGCTQSARRLSTDLVVFRNSRTGSEFIKSTQQLVNESQTPEEFLSTFFWFRSLSWSMVNKAARCFEVVNVPARKSIVVAGEKGDCLYVITDGTVVVTATSESGEKKVIRTMGKNEVFGEFGLIHDVPRTVNVDAKTPVTLLKLYKEVYEREKDAKYMKKLRSWLESAAESIVGGAISNVSILSSLPPETVQILSRMFRIQVVPKGYQVCQQGTIGKHYYILSHGELLVSITDDENVEVELGRLTDGATFGEVSLLEDTPRAASITAATECNLLSLDRDDFDSFLSIVPSLANGLSNTLRSRTAVRSLTEKIPFFQYLKKETIHQMAVVCSVKRYKPGRAIVRAGQVQPLKFFIITEGEAEVIVDGKVVKTLGTGDYFGEVSIISAVPHSATVQVPKKGGYTYCLECKKSEFETLFATEPAILAEIQLKANGVKSELSAVIHHPIGRQYLMRHVAKEFATENVDFWREVENLRRFRKRVLSPDALDILGINPTEYEARIHNEVTAKAKGIISKYVVDGAPAQVNLIDETKREILRLLKEDKLDETSFNVAQHQIYTLMERDNFARFRDSEMFEEMIQEIGTYYRRDNDAAFSKLDQRTTQALN